MADSAHLERFVLFSKTVSKISILMTKSSRAFEVKVMPQVFGEA